MKRVNAYVLEVKEEQIVKIPSEDILSVAVLDKDIVVYALVDVDNPISNSFEIRVHGSGYDIKDDIVNFKFLGTVTIYNAILELHVFYRKIE